MRHLATLVALLVLSPIFWHTPAAMAQENPPEPDKEEAQKPEQAEPNGPGEGEEKTPEAPPEDSTKLLEAIENSNVLSMKHGEVSYLPEALNTKLAYWAILGDRTDILNKEEIEELDKTGVLYLVYLEYVKRAR